MQKTPEQRRRLAELIGEGVPIREAMMKAGWSESQANKGWAKVPKAITKALPKKTQRLIALGKATLRDDVEALVSGRLIDNVTKGSDKGAQSAKILGSRKDLGMWHPDLQTGLVVIGQLPSHLEARARELLKDGD